MRSGDETGEAAATGLNDDASASPVQRVSFSRLRERTDELELFISGLLAFALLAAPSRLFQAWASNSVHVDGMHAQAMWFAFSIGVGLCYVLGGALVIHLAIRGYWVGLISLKGNFPQGVRWDRIPMFGEVSRRFQRERNVSLDAAIASADRAASVLFSSTLLFTLSMVWVGVLSAVLLTLAGVVGGLFGLGDGPMLVLIGLGLVAVLLLSLLPYPLEKYVAKVRQRGGDAPRTVRCIHALLRVGGAATLMRLSVPVQLTLQSHAGTRRFTFYFAAAVMLAMLIGALPVVNSAMFAMFGRYTLVTSEAVDGGMLSAHYESMRVEGDRLNRFPMIPSDRIDKPTLRVFIPHQPQRDNVLARERCADLGGDHNEAEGRAAARRAVACLQRLWTVTLDGKPVSLDGFEPIERRDLELRGIVGYLPLAKLPPGRHDLALSWNINGEARGPQRRRDFSIPFWYDVAQ